MSVLYHPDKAKVVENVLSRMTMGSMSNIEDSKKDLAKYVHRWDRLGIRLEDSPNGGFMVPQNSKSYLVVEVMSKQHRDQPLMELKEIGSWKA